MIKDYLNNPKVRIGLAVLVILVGWLGYRFLVAQPTLITVSGIGKVTAEPKMVVFSIAVTNNSGTSTLALSENNRLVKEISAVLNNNGVVSSDIQLAYPRLISPQTSLGQSSWQAVNSINATLKDVSKFDNLVIQLYLAGAQSVSNIYFTTENAADLEKEAVALAIKETKQRAKELAKAAGKSLGRMVSIATEEAGDASALSGTAGNAAGAMTTKPTQIEITRQASIVFELR